MTRVKRFGGMVLALTAALAAQALAQRVTVENGVNRKGNDYTSFRTGELEECRRACDRDRRCQAYTYNHVVRDGLCYLEDKIGKREPDADKISGIKRRL